MSFDYEEAFFTVCNDCYFSRKAYCANANKLRLH